MKLGEMPCIRQATGAEPGGEGTDRPMPRTPTDPPTADEDVVDADFEEVKDDEDKKSA